MSMLPIIYPSVTGVPGVIESSRERVRVQCEECGIIATSTPGMRWPWNMLLWAGVKFHTGGWPDGTNPRLCTSCRLARGCECGWCAPERRSYGDGRLPDGVIWSRGAA